MLLANRRQPPIALLLTVPLNSIGVIASLWMTKGNIGQALQLIFQIWLLIFPIAWLFWIEHKPLKISSPKKRDWIIGITLGLLMLVVILAIYFFIAKYWIDVDYIREKVKTIGFVNPFIFQIAGAYLIFVNSFIEEYFWRWFVFRRCRELINGKKSVFLTAFLFTLHHIFVLAAYTDWRMVLLGSLAVFTAGALWSAYYRRYKSIWGSYFSHALVVLALYIIAWQILFG